LMDRCFVSSGLDAVPFFSLIYKIIQDEESLYYLRLLIYDITLSIITYFRPSKQVIQHHREFFDNFRLTTISTMTSVYDIMLSANDAVLLLHLLE
jgi:hypothetical protein